MFHLLSRFFALFCFCFVFISPGFTEKNQFFEIDDPPSETKYLKANYYELELGSAFHFRSNLNKDRVGLALFAGLLQDQILSTKIKHVSLLTGGEFRYNCLRNPSAEVCLFMLGPVLSFRENNEFVQWIEYQLDFRGGMAYSRLSNRSAGIPGVRNGVLGYLSINPGISFLIGRVGFRASYFLDLFFYPDRFISSHAGSFGLFTRF